MTLRLEHVSKTYQRGPELVHALQGISLEIDPGGITALVGPSGSGKTTLLNIVSGWELGDTGSLTWDGGEVHSGLGWDKVAVIPQRLGLLEDLSVRENVELPWVLARRPAEEGRRRADDLLARLEISKLTDRLPADTSLGEQQRTSVARALMLAPRLLLADEPSGNQDARRRGLVFDALQEATEAGVICLLATHDPGALAYCRRTIRLDHGTLVGDDTGSTDDRQRSLWGPRP